MAALTRRAAAALAGLTLVLLGGSATAEVVTQLPTHDKVVALTFDACEAFTKMQLDAGIVDYLTARKVPFTVFMGGRFARDNARAVRAIAALPYVEIENHSWSHNNNMPQLSDTRVRDEVLWTQWEIKHLTGHKPWFFRFPAGKADERTVGLVEALGLTVVHWRYAEGDPDPTVSAEALVKQTLKRTRPGDILIFHINGRGVHTAEALPGVIDGLTARGYRFVRLVDYLPRPHPTASSHP
jgi:peptidoglycan/xylan/chitin deacetylase (PgdA/CDA1 family)